jgi:uncharacterized protein YjiK
VGASDAAGCHFDAETSHLLVVSDEDACVIECTLDGREVARMRLEGAPQAEGVTLDDRRNLYVVSEPNLLFVFSREAPGGG